LRGVLGRDYGGGDEDGPATQARIGGGGLADRRPLIQRVKILFIGDVVGEPGRRAVAGLAAKLRARMGADVVVANGENAAGGAGITRNTARELFAAGVDIITTGDHIWDQKEAAQLLPEEPRLLRPANYPAGTPGQGSVVWPSEGSAILAVINLQGRVFMPAMDDPFRAARDEVARARSYTSTILVDFHAEATSEKIALARWLDGQVSAVIGTHTHVQTADEQVMPGGTAFLCDAGFTGPHDGVIGREAAPVIERFLTGMPRRFEVARGRVHLQGALIDVDEATGRARAIERVSEPLGG